MYGDTYDLINFHSVCCMYTFQDALEYGCVTLHFTLWPFCVHANKGEVLIGHMNNIGKLQDLLASTETHFMPLLSESWTIIYVRFS